MNIEDYQKANGIAISGLFLDKSIHLILCQKRQRLLTIDVWSICRLCSSLARDSSAREWCYPYCLGFDKETIELVEYQEYLEKLVEEGETIENDLSI